MDKDMYQFIWKITYLWPHRMWCFIVGHHEVSGGDLGGRLEPDWCAHCFIDWPQDKIAMPVLLNRAYVWAVNHGWPEWLDLWLMKHIKLPSWWEY